MEAILASGIEFTIYFYNPNIHPLKEYLIRKEENIRFACQSDEVRFGQDRYGYNEGVELHGGRRYGD